jgi:hypothetical protein
MAIMQRTGKEVNDKATNRSYRRLGLLAVVEHIFRNTK